MIPYFCRNPIPLNASETTIIQQLIAGDNTAFESIFREHYPILVGFAGKFVEEHAVAEELVQELFVQIWEKRENLHLSGSLKSYLFTSVRNSALNHLKHLKVRKGYQDYMVARETPQGEKNPIEAAELASRIDQAVKSLPERCREVFVLSRQEGLTYGEIADRMEISKKTVEVQMGKALRNLRSHLKAWLPLLLLILLNGK